MWNLTSRPRAASPHCWTNHSHLGVYKDSMDSPLIIMPEKLSEDTTILRARAVIPAAVNISSAAPKPPKKRFLEAAAAAHELEEQQRLQQQQQEKGRAGGEDNSALMQLAEMCVYYQASNAGHPSGSWSPSVTGAWKCVNRRVNEEESIDPTIYSISMSSAVQSEVNSPKAGTPFWGWASSRPLVQSEQGLDEEEEENEEPLDLSGEETIRTNQQELIDHLVEKLCARPVSGKFSSLVQKKLSLLEPPENSQTPAVTCVQNSSSEVSSSIDSKDSVTAAVKDVRRDLPLKKRDPSSLQQSYDQQGGDFCDSSTTASTKPESPSTQVVTSTNSSKKPAPRSCKGKRYLEFMYEGRIALGSGRLKRTESSSNEQAEDQTTAATTACDQSSIVGTRKRQRHVKHTEPLASGKPTFSLRGRNAKLRKLS